MAFYYREGIGVAADPEAAAMWERRFIARLEELAEAGYLKETGFLESFYRAGYATEVNRQRAAYWRRRIDETRLRRAKAGDVESMLALVEVRRSELLGRELVVCQDPTCPIPTDHFIEPVVSDRVDWLQRAVDAGSAEAMVLRGRVLELKGTRGHLTEAAALYRRAAELGHGEAMGRLGVCYRTGRGVERDDAAAFEWWMRGAERGDPGAIVSVGDAFQFGIGVEGDFAAAAEWYHRAARAIDATGCLRLGECYEHGRGVEQDLDEAAYWYDWAIKYCFDEDDPLAEAEAAYERVTNR